MNNSLLQSIRQNKRRVQVTLYFVFSFVIVSQFISSHHQVQHLSDFNDIACMQCVATPDYLYSSNNIVDCSLDLKSIVHAETLIVSVTTPPPVYYSSRAPPIFS